MDIAACYTLKTRAAYHWLKKNQQVHIYNQYLNGELARDEFYARTPQSVLNTILNREISEEALPVIFNEIDEILEGQKLDLIIGGPPVRRILLQDEPDLKTECWGIKEIISINCTQNS